MPSKTIIDLYCPLSTTQKNLYVDFQKKLRISDSKLEEELLAIRNSELTSVSDSKSKSDSNTNETLHPLKAFFYLRYLCVHPSLVIAKVHEDYKKRLITESGMSGKMDRLVRLLIDCQVVLEDECDRLSDLPVIDGEIKERQTSTISYDDNNSDDGIDDNDNNNDNNNDDNDDDDHMTARNHFMCAVKKKVASATTISARKSIKRPAISSSSMTIPFHRALIFVQHKEALDLVEEVIILTNIS